MSFCICVCWLTFLLILSHILCHYWVTSFFHQFPDLVDFSYWELFRQDKECLSSRGNFSLISRPYTSEHLSVLYLQSFPCCWGSTNNICVSSQMCSFCLLVSVSFPSISKPAHALMCPMLDAHGAPFRTLKLGHCAVHPSLVLTLWIVAALTFLASWLHFLNSRRLPASSWVCPYQSVTWNSLRS